MDHPSPHEHVTPAPHGAHAVPAGQPYFGAAEWEAFRAEDRRGAAVISSLMAGIFATGLLMYAAIAWIASQ